MMVNRIVHYLVPLVWYRRSWYFIDNVQNFLSMFEYPAYPMITKDMSNMNRHFTRCEFYKHYQKTGEISTTIEHSKVHTHVHSHMKYRQCWTYNCVNIKYSYISAGVFGYYTSSYHSWTPSGNQIESELCAIEDNIWIQLRLFRGKMYMQSKNPYGRNKGKRLWIGKIGLRMLLGEVNECQKDIGYLDCRTVEERGWQSI